MSLVALDLLLHGGLLVVDAGVLAGVRARPARALLICALGAAFALVVLGSLAAALTGDGFALMRAAAWTLFVHGPADLVVAAALARRERPLDAAVLGACGVGAGLVGGWSLVVEPRWLDVEVIRVAAPGLEEPLTVVILADLQNDAFGAWDRSAIAQAMDAEPDLVLLPGDFVQVHDGVTADYQDQVARFRRLIEPLEAPLGVYAVRGNAEWREAWADDLFGGTQVTSFRRTASVDLGPLVLTGLDFFDGFDVGAEVDAAPGFHLAFAHAPDFSLSGDVEADVLVAGHTHGGQVQIPLFGPPVTYSKVPRAWAAGGAHDVGDGRTLVVSRGVGMERVYAPRLRFNCRPHVVILELEPAPERPFAE